MGSPMGLSFDFDYWRKLAENDPPAFEFLRRQMIEAYLEQLNEDDANALRKLQWRIDGVRRRSKHPMRACVSFSEMMWNSVDENLSYMRQFKLLRRD